MLEEAYSQEGTVRYWRGVGAAAGQEVLAAEDIPVSEDNPVVHKVQIVVDIPLAVAFVECHTFQRASTVDPLNFLQRWSQMCSWPVPTNLSRQTSM